MKKQKFANLNLGKVEVLSREQMAATKGGGGYVQCYNPNQTGSYCWCSYVNYNTNPASCYQW